MTSPQILVVVPDSDLRHSLRFALEAEHFEVTWRASIGAQLFPGAYQCTVLDHHALGPDLAEARKFVELFHPVVLLANQTHELSPLAFRTLLKPHLGAPLIAAVSEALAAAVPH